MPFGLLEAGLALAVVLAFWERHTKQPLPPRRPLGAGPGLSPVHRLLQPDRHGTELRVIFVAVYHLITSSTWLWLW